MENEDYGSSSKAKPRQRNVQAVYNHNLESESRLRRMSDNPDLSLHDRKRRMRKRVQKLALKILLKDDSEEDSTTDDLLDDPQRDESSNVLASLAALLSKDYKFSQTAERDFQYKAEFYHYIRHYDEQHIAQLHKTILNQEPISINSSTRASNVTNINCFEVTSKYVIPERIKTADDITISEAVLAYLGTYITIRSRLVIEYLKHTVLYYPAVSFDTDELVLEEPFCVLLHYQPELQDRCSSGDLVTSELGSADEDEYSAGLKHFKDLNNFLEQRYTYSLSLEVLRHRGHPAMCTYEWMWLLFKPGSLVYSLVDGVLEAFIVEQHDKDAPKEKDRKTKPPNIRAMDVLERTTHQETLRVTVWYLAFNGEHLGRCREVHHIPKFDGEKSILSLPIFPHEFMKHDKRVHESLSTQDYLIGRGKLFCEMIRRSYRHYEGDTANSPKRIIRGRVMVDTKYFVDSGYTRYAKVGISKGSVRRIQLRDTAGWSEDKYTEALPSIIGTRRNASWDSSVLHYQRHDRLRYPGEDANYFLETKDVYAHYDGITSDKLHSLDSQQYMICVPTVMAFVLKTRQVEELFVDKFSKPIFQVDLMKELVLEDDAKAMVKALSQRYTMHAETNDTWSADFVKNKGEGQIFLLHGKPGVGKTTTAECVAELTQRPLLSLTCGDLGVNPEDLESRLNQWLKMAEIWGAILLLDEADVYLESRITQDLRRNTLVSIFLRALEYYQGLLFLTTNRVGTFDDAFVSRIHVVIHYPDFTNEKRCQIWDIFFNKLEREKENIKFTQRTVDYAKESKEIQSLGWNGREIRNAFSTAVALAEFENDRDDKKRVIFHARHLEQVVKMSRAFQDYLKSTHGMSQAEQARRYRIRNDFWNGLEEKGAS